MRCKSPQNGLNAAVKRASRAVWNAGELLEGVDQVASEQAIALVYNGISHVVMMATPCDLEDFALGFSLSEGIIDSPQQLLDIEPRSLDKGIELAITIAAEPFARLKQKRRNLTGRTGCGLCGAESLEQAIPQLDTVKSTLAITHQALQRAIVALDKQRCLQQQTGALHGAAWCDPEGQIGCLREDVGRHNALDKLLGAMAKQALDSHSGFLLITSRASYEMVVKAVRANVGLLAAVSAPTTLAIALAEQSNMGLVGFSRAQRHVIYAGQRRLINVDATND
jgi:FdhD protein